MLLVISAWMVSGVGLGENRITDPQYQIQGDMYDAAIWIDDATAPDSVVGSFNSGIVGYYSDRTTINLDGVVDGRALDALKQRELTTYLDERCVTIVADFRFYAFWYQAFWDGGTIPDLRELAAFSDAIAAQIPEIASPFTVWAYEPSTSRSSLC